MISTIFVVTAAHCVVKRGTSREIYDSFTVFTGEINNKLFRISITAKNVIVHEKYDRLYSDNYDIALIELKLPMPLSKIVKIADLAQNQPPPGSLLNIVVWGKTEANKTSDDLLYATMTVMGDDCDKYLNGMNDPKSVVCTIGPRGEGICSGDSGGPFYLKDTNTLVAITSFGYDTEENRCDMEKPSVGTSVYYYLHWIKKHIS